MFGDIDPGRMATRALMALTQTGSAMAYTLRFQQLRMRLSYGETELYDRYYAGLKDEVKDELARDRSEGLVALIKMANVINMRHYERAQERKGQYAPAIRKYKPASQLTPTSY